MRFPWQNRVDEEKKQREYTEQHLCHVQEQWPVVHRALAPMRRERARNGWTEVARVIFGGGSPTHHPPRKDHP